MEYLIAVLYNTMGLFSRMPPGGGAAQTAHNFEQ
jgi:hypothetical protein